MKFYQKNTNIVEVDGVSFEFSNEPPTQEGETYIAERNTGPELLTVSCIIHGFIVPKEKFKYCYDVHECRKVIKML